MKSLTAFGLATVLVLAAGQAAGHDGGGGVDLRHRHCPRATAMGETGLVPAAGAGGFTTNPALLTWDTSLTVRLGYGQLVEEVPASVTSFSAVLPFGPSLDVPGTGEIGHLFSAGLGVDHGGVDLAQGTEWGWNLASLAMGYRFAPYASCGLSFKYFMSTSDLAGSEVSAYALDLGAVVEVSSWASVGVTVSNPVGSADWDKGESESPPLIVGVGAGFNLPFGVRAEIAGTITRSNPAKVGAGIEVPVETTGFYIRGGYLRYSGDYSRDVFSSGFGYTLRKFVLDYAVKLDDELALGTTHHFAFGYSFP